jgi:ribosomal protein S14
MRGIEDAVLAEWFGEDAIPERCEVCGKQPVVGVFDGAEVLGVCRDCLDEASTEERA